MKLSPTGVNQTLGQFEAQAVPDDHPAMAQLNGLFGEHTYFVNGDGLNIVEPAGGAGNGAEKGQVVKVASWSDETQSSLTPHEPEPTDVVIVLEPTA